MAKIDWKSVTREDVQKAISIFLSENPEYPTPRSTFLLYDGKKLPAKHIRGMAYKVANNIEVSKADYAGGMETVRFFERLGFEVYYTGTGKKNPSTISIEQQIVSPKSEEGLKKENLKGNERIRISSNAVIEQKNALQLILNKMFGGDIVCEKTYSWLKTPEKIEGEYVDLYDALYTYRGNKSFAKKNVILRCDFVCEGKKLIIEYDERQHFSEARKISLEAYKNVQLEYDRNLWIRACEDIQAKDNQPANRDEIRAFYDSVRDIEAAKHGYRLIRIMHGQIDFAQDDAVDKLNRLLNVRNDISVENTEIISSNIAGRCGRDYKVDLKIAMYIQTESYRNETEFDKAVKCIKKSEADILVFPEDCWVPFDDEIASSDVLKQEDLEILFDRCLDLSEKMGCAVIVSGMDYYNTLFSIYANFNAGDEDTVCSLYIKHTMTDCSAFEVCENYQELANELFTPILLRGYTIGMTICYDCNHAIFSRMYGIQGIDVIINSTGGNVKYDKWYKYNKVRAIENISYTLCTMGGAELKENNNSYVLGFNRKGKLLEPFLLNGESEQVNVPGGIYLYNLKNDDDSEELDRSFGQLSTENKKQDLFIPEGNVDSLLMKSEKVDENLYVYEHSSGNIIFCVTSGDVIFKAEEFLPLIYSEKLEKFKNKKYIIISKYKNLDAQMYQNQLSCVLKVRAMENLCAVIFESDIVNACFQTGFTRAAQVVKAVNGEYGLDTSRMTGPETIWKDKQGMKKTWRDNFVWLCNECKRLADTMELHSTYDRR